MKAIFNIHVGNYYLVEFYVNFNAMFSQDR
jgi:hypothetical protein